MLHRNPLVWKFNEGGFEFSEEERNRMLKDPASGITHVTSGRVLFDDDDSEDD
jgi:hypothetical protein